MRQIIQRFSIVITLLATTAYGSTASWRDYGGSPSTEEIKDIAYIITNLGFKSMASVIAKSSQMKAAGKRIDHVHPFRLLEVIFTNEEYRTAFHSIRRRGWAWSEYYTGFSQSMTEEQRRDNLTDQQLESFCHTIGVSPTQLSPYLSRKDWIGFVDKLLALFPRTGGDRYHQ